MGWINDRKLGRGLQDCRNAIRENNDYEVWFIRETNTERKWAFWNDLLNSAIKYWWLHLL